MKRSQGGKRRIEKKREIEGSKAKRNNNQGAAKQHQGLDHIITPCRTEYRAREESKEKKKRGLAEEKRKKAVPRRGEEKKIKKIATSMRLCRVQSRRQRRRPSLPSNQVHHPVCSSVNRRSKRSSLLQVLDQVLDIIQIPAQQSLLFICCPRITNYFTRSRGSM